MTDLAALLPHQGAMVMLDRVLGWDDAHVVAATRRHLDPANPLRRAGHLPAVAGVEFALQAAALHGALRDGGRAQRAGYVARLRDVDLHTSRLDDPAHGTLRVSATLEHAEGGGMLYALAVAAESGAPLVTARAGVVLP